MTTRDIDLEDINEHIARDDEAKRAGTEEATARIVAWLRSPQCPWDYSERVADDIERGEHLK
jgi:hypothetical protein